MKINSAFRDRNLKKISRFLNLEKETIEGLQFATEDFFQFFPDLFPDFSVLETTNLIDAAKTVFISSVLILFIFPVFQISKENKFF